MDNAVVTQERKGPEELDRETTDERGRKAGKAVRLDQLVEVDAEQLGHDAEVSSERERVDHSDHKVLLVRVLHIVNDEMSGLRPETGRGGSTHPFDEVLEHLDLDQGLVMETLLVADDLDRDHVARLVIPALQDLAERSFPENVDDLVAVVKVVVRDEEIVATLVVVAVVVRRLVFRRHLLVAVWTDKVDFAIIPNLVFFVRRQEPGIERQGVCDR